MENSPRRVSARKYFEQAVKQFAQTWKTTDGFTILQGKELLEI